MTVTLHLPDDLAERLTDVARAQGMAVESYIGAILRAHAGALFLSAPQPAEPAVRPRYLLDALMVAEGVPTEELMRMPEDGAEQHDHYIYGVPKREPL